MRELSEQEINALHTIQLDLTDGLERWSGIVRKIVRESIKEGFAAGLDYQQTEIDRLQMTLTKAENEVKFLRTLLSTHAIHSKR